jgi:Phosphotransferase enzyme family
VDLAAAAQAVLGVPVEVGAKLSGHDRNEVRRARTADGTPVVLKLTGTGSGAARELAALRLAAGLDVPAPRLLGWSDEPALLVLEDLGDGPTLADRLLGHDPGEAADALVAWATALGRFGAATAGVRDRFGELLTEASPLGPPAVDSMGEELAAAAADLERDLPLVGVTPTPAALDELRGLAAALDVPGSAAMTPGDTCPDNMIETPGGPVLIDFEGAEHTNVAWVAAYLRVPWPTCWCCWALPGDVSDRALAAWTDAVDLPYVREDRFAADLDLAVCGWAFVSTAWFLRRAVEDDSVRQPRPMPKRRAMVQNRLAVAAPLAPPALAALAEEVHAATVREWGAQPLLLAPAFRQPPGGC